MGNKKCSDCLEEKPIDSFYKKSDSKDGLHYYCKICHNKRNRIASKKWISTSKGKEYMRSYSAKLRKLDKWKEYNRNYSREYQKSEKGLEQRRIIDKRKRANPHFKVDSNFSRAIRLALNGKKNRQSWVKLVGYSLKELTEHLEKQFDSKMTWANYGSYWHIDHIKPRGHFIYSSHNESAFKECWALSNLRPLEAIENIKKGNKII